MGKDARFRYLKHIAVTPAKLVEFCRKRHLTYFALFGSVLREDFSATSDVDVLYRFHPDHIPGWGFVDIIEELEKLVGRKVDFVARDFIAPAFRDSILKDVEVIYEETQPARKRSASRAAHAAVRGEGA